MSLPHRYTGCWPPLDVLAAYPNWVCALDEEGAEGQDETTIKPETQQLYISEETGFTAADVTLSSGERCPAVMSLLDGAPDSIDIFDGKSWCMVRRAYGRQWEISPRDVLQPGSRLFPLTVTSRLALASDERISFNITAEGMSNARKKYF